MKRFLLRAFLLLIPLIIAKHSLSQPGTLDSSFGIKGKVPTIFNGYEVQGTGLIIQTDGRIVVTGYAYNDGLDIQLRRYLQTGLPDSSFGTNGKILTNFNSKNDIVQCAARDSTNRILVGGTTTVDGFNYDFELVCFKVNGVLDSTFGTNGRVITNLSIGPNQGNDQIRTILVQKDNKIVCIGSNYTSDNGVTSFALVRYKPSGVIDSTFGISGKTITSFVFNGTSEPFGAALQKDGKIVAAGYVRNGITNIDFAIARYTSNGFLDSTFGTNGKVETDFGSNEDFARAVAIQADGKIVVVGKAMLSNTDYSTNISIARYSESGQLDATFGTNGKIQTITGTYSEAFALQIQPDSKLLVGSRTTGPSGPFTKWGLFRYKTNGTLDSTFGINGKTLTDWGNDGAINSMVLLNDGKLIATGYGVDPFSGYYNYPVARYKIYDTISVSLQKNISVNEGAVGILTPAIFTINLNKAATKQVKVNYHTRNLSAKSGSDYVAKTGTVAFPVGTTSKTITVNVKGDNTVEPNDRFALVITDPLNAALGTIDSAICIIKNDDPSFAKSSERSDVKIGEIKIYPNPVTDILNIQGLVTKDKVQLSIVDVNGKVLATKSVNTSSYALNIKALPMGSYFLQIQSKDKTETLPFIKQ